MKHKPIFIFMIVLFFFGNVLANPQKYGVFVGIGKYKTASLLTSTNDAQKMREKLVADFGFAERNTSLILDDNAKKNLIISEIEKYLKAANPGDIFVFYYSGHGTIFLDAKSEEMDESKYDNALVPIDSADATGDKIWKNLILDDELFEIFTRFTNKNVGVIFISDSCYSGGQNKGIYNPKLGKGKTLTPFEALGIKKWEDLPQIDTKNQRRVSRKIEDTKGLYLSIASSTDQETSFSGSSDSDNLSIFTYYFLQALENKKTLTFPALITDVSKNVSVYAKNSDSRQTPILSKDFFQGNLDASIFSFETFKTNSRFTNTAK